MKLLASAAFAAAALATATFGATPAEARSSFGVYVGGPGYYYSGYNYRNRCDDYWYRRRHPRRCGYYYDYDDYDYGYYPNSYYYYDDDYYYRPSFGFRFYGDRHRHRHWSHHRRHRDGYGRRHW